MLASSCESLSLMMAVLVPRPPVKPWMMSWYRTWALTLSCMMEDMIFQMTPKRPMPQKPPSVFGRMARTAFLLQLLGQFLLFNCSLDSGWIGFSAGGTKE
jgi:hypothetical protein